MKKVSLIMIVSLLLPSMPLIASAEPPFGLAMGRLQNLERNGEKPSEKELDRLLVDILTDFNRPLKIRIIAFVKVLATTEVMFGRDIKPYPLKSAAVLRRLEEMEDVSSTGSPSFKKALNSILRVEMRNADLSKQELADLSLAIWHENTPFLQKKKEVKLLRYFASESGFSAEMPEVISKLIEEEREFERKKALARREEERLKEVRRREAIKERKRAVEAERIKQEKLKMRAVEQCSKGWEARKPGRISGAFGINFGCKFDTEFSLGEHALTDGTPMYLFKPKSKFRSFSRYYVIITPKTHQVYSIWGRGDVENTQTGQKEQAVILSILEKKYGKRKDSGIVGSLYDAESIVKGDKSIMVKVTGFIDTTLEVRYYDDTLKALAEKERIEIESSKVDDSGF